MLDKKLVNLVDAGFSAIWVYTSEPDEAQRSIAKLAEQHEWKLSTWDCMAGLKGLVNDKAQGTPNPLSPITTYLSRNAAEKEAQVILLHNYHRFLENPQVVQGVINASLVGKGTQTFYVVLSPVRDLPLELQKVFTILEHPLPGEEELKAVLEEVSDGSQGTTAEVINAAKGMTRRQAEDAFSLSMVEHEGTISSETIWDLKKGFVNDRGYMSFSRGGPGFESIEGLDNLKRFTKNLLRPESTVPSKGVMLLGPPGTGKSHLCKALGNETGRPTIVLDFGALYQKHVGDTEKNIRDALATADAMGRVVLMIDEVEKALAGAGGDGDSGVAARAFGTFLTWLSDREEKKSDVFVVMTSNDISKLPPEFTRAERVDAVFFLDLPNDIERAKIWDLYEQKYALPAGKRYNKKLFEDKGWTGAEIKACCRLAASLGVGVKESSSYIVPVSVTSGEKIQALREWAKGRCISATYEGAYTGENAPAILQETPRRKVNYGSTKKEEA